MRPPGRRGRGLRRAGFGGRGGRVCVSGGGRGSGSEGRRRGAVCALSGPGWARPPSGHCLRDSGCAGLCACARVFVARGRRVCICVCAGPSLCLPPARGAVPPARGCFPNRLPAETGSAAAPAGGGSAAPTGLQRPGRPWDCRQTPEGGRGRAPGRGPEACPPR